MTDSTCRFPAGAVNSRLGVRGLVQTAASRRLMPDIRRAGRPVPLIHCIPPPAGRSISRKLFDRSPRSFHRTCSAWSDPELSVMPPRPPDHVRRVSRCAYFTSGAPGNPMARRPPRACMLCPATRFFIPRPGSAGGIELAVRSAASGGGELTFRDLLHEEARSGVGGLRLA
jgi:hypothetical protein